MVNLNVKKYEMSPWWKHCYLDPHFTKQCRVISKLLLDVHRRGRIKCKLCSNGLDSPTHILFECTQLFELRSLKWQDIKHSCLSPLIVSLETMNDYDKCTFILNGFNIEYTQEWKAMYDTISDFVYHLCTMYDKQCANEDN